MLVKYGGAFPFLFVCESYKFITLRTTSYNKFNRLKLLPSVIRSPSAAPQCCVFSRNRFIASHRNYIGYPTSPYSTHCVDSTVGTVNDFSFTNPPVMIPIPLISFMKTKIQWGLEIWLQSSNVEDTKDIVESIVLYVERRTLQQEGGSIKNQKQINKYFLDYGTLLSKALRGSNGNIADIQVADIEVVIENIMKSYQQYIATNRAVYVDINRHHDNIVEKQWEEVIVDESSLEKYASAAKAMGEKTWVVEANKWMENFSLNYFRRNGARKEYLRLNKPKSFPSSLKYPVYNDELNDSSDDADSSLPKYKNIEFQSESQWVDYAASIPRDLMLSETFLYSNCKASMNQENNKEISNYPSSSALSSAFSSSLSSSTASTASTSAVSSSSVLLPSHRKIRLLDVGSCYNPIGQSENSSFFDVTALDLCPTDPSVYTCDFLALQVGSNNSKPIITEEQSTLVNSSTKDNDKRNNINNTTHKNSDKSSYRLISLPAASYDVVTMSLVLNYLPTPQQRLEMVKKLESY